MLVHQKKYHFDNEAFHCVYFLNVIYFWEDVHRRLEKIFNILKPNGKVIIFMADAGYFGDNKPSEGEKIFYLHSIGHIVEVMKETGFESIETREHSLEKKCFYITGYKK